MLDFIKALKTFSSVEKRPFNNVINSFIMTSPTLFYLISCAECGDCTGSSFGEVKAHGHTQSFRIALYIGDGFDYYVKIFSWLN